MPPCRNHLFDTFTSLPSSVPFVQQGLCNAIFPQTGVEIRFSMRLKKETVLSVTGVVALMPRRQFTGLWNSRKMESGHCSAFLTVKANGSPPYKREKWIPAMPAAVEFHVFRPLDAKVVFEPFPAFCGPVFSDHIPFVTPACLTLTS